MYKKVLALVLSVTISAVLFAGCSKTSSESIAESSSDENTTSAAATAAPANNFEGKELSILVSEGWMDNRYDATIERFEESYGVTVELQTVPADQYSDVLKMKLSTGNCADIFWIQSDPFAIGTQIGDPTKYCIDFTDADWASKIPETRLQSCEYNEKLYGLQIWHNSPEYVMVYNKTLFDENGWTVPATYADLKALCEKIAAAGITPWFIPGADGWQQQLAFFQIGGVYEKATPGLYDALNNNTATFADNEKMLEVLNQFKELSDAGYFGKDWINTDSSNMSNDFGGRNIAMAMANSSFIKQIQEDTGSSDDFQLFLNPLGDNDTFPTNPGGPTMFGYAGSEQQDLVKEFFSFCMTTESLQEILDSSSAYTNLDIEDDQLQQRWLPAEQAFMSSVSEDKMKYSVLQTATKYTNAYWMDFGADMVSLCQNNMEANDVLKDMDAKRAEAAKTAGDSAWSK